MLAAGAFTTGIVAGYHFSKRSVDFKMSLTPAQGEASGVLNVGLKADGNVVKATARSLVEVIENNPMFFR